MVPRVKNALWRAVLKSIVGQLDQVGSPSHFRDAGITGEASMITVALSSADFEKLRGPLGQRSHDRGDLVVAPRMTEWRNFPHLLR